MHGLGLACPPTPIANGNVLTMFMCCQYLVPYSLQCNILVLMSLLCSFQCSILKYLFITKHSKFSWFKPTLIFFSFASYHYWFPKFNIYFFITFKYSTSFSFFKSFLKYLIAFLHVLGKQACSCFSFRRDLILCVIFLIIAFISSSIAFFHL